MANTQSAKKAIRSSARKKSHNAMWEKKIKNALKVLKEGIATRNAKIEDLNKQLSVLQKALDKAAKEKVIHVNKANRLKSMYAHKISVRSADKSTKQAAKSTK